MLLERLVTVRDLAEEAPYLKWLSVKKYRNEFTRKIAIICCLSKQVFAFTLIIIVFLNGF